MKELFEKVYVKKNTLPKVDGTYIAFLDELGGRIAFTEYNERQKLYWLRYVKYYFIEYKV